MVNMFLLKFHFLSMEYAIACIATGVPQLLTQILHAFSISFDWLAPNVSIFAFKIVRYSNAFYFLFILIFSRRCHLKTWSLVFTLLDSILLIVLATFQQTFIHFIFLYPRLNLPHMQWLDKLLVIYFFSDLFFEAFLVFTGWFLRFVPYVHASTSPIRLWLVPRTNYVLIWLYLIDWWLLWYYSLYAFSVGLLGRTIIING